jgi:hypothetical protein
MTLKKVYKKERKVIIYEIVCNITGERYIGSTIQSLNKRIEAHIYLKTCSSKYIIERNNYQKNQLEIFYTRFEFCRLLKEQYYLDNTININKQRCLYLDRNRKKEKEKLYYKNNTTKKKEYYNSNSEYFKNKSKINREKNKEKLKEKRQNAISINCPCGGKYKKREKTKHLQTKRHKKYIKYI